MITISCPIWIWEVHGKMSTTVYIENYSWNSSLRPTLVYPIIKISLFGDLPTEASLYKFPVNHHPVQQPSKKSKQKLHRNIFLCRDITLVLILPCTRILVWFSWGLKRFSNTSPDLPTFFSVLQSKYITMNIL